MARCIALDFGNESGCIRFAVGGVFDAGQLLFQCAQLGDAISHQSHLQKQVNGLVR